MQIVSPDKKSRIEILRIEDDEYSSYSFSCNIDIGHGQFTAKNSDIQILNLHAFIQDFDSFIISRIMRPKLEGTYDTCLEFYKAFSGNSIMLKFIKLTRHSTSLQLIKHSKTLLKKAALTKINYY